MTTLAPLASFAVVMAAGTDREERSLRSQRSLRSPEQLGIERGTLLASFLDLMYLDVKRLAGGYRLSGVRRQDGQQPVQTRRW